MLTPVYVVGFILGGLLLFAIARRVPNRTAKIWLRAIGLLAGPVFFLVVTVFSGWEREKTYQMQWLIGGPAVRYLGSGVGVGTDEHDVVVLRRDLGHQHECFEEIVSSDLVQYLARLPGQTVEVQYEVMYDFYQVRKINIERIGEFGKDDASRLALFHGLRVEGEKRGPDAPRVSCFSW